MYARNSWSSRWPFFGRMTCIERTLQHFSNAFSTANSSYVENMFNEALVLLSSGFMSSLLVLMMHMFLLFSFFVIMANKGKSLFRVVGPSLKVRRQVSAHAACCLILARWATSHARSECQRHRSECLSVHSKGSRTHFNASLSARINNLVSLGYGRRSNSEYAIQKKILCVMPIFCFLSVRVHG